MIHNLLKDKKVILASASPRRKYIFDMLGINALQMSADLAEEIFTQNPRKLVKVHAQSKAKAIRKKVESDYLIVGSDTIVFQNHDILVKPKDKFQAAELLSRLSDNSHYVYSGIAIAYKNQIISAYEKTRVTFQKITPQEIEEYIKTNEPMDKAGAYGIQGYGSQFISRLSGCYFNVMGFPINCFYRLLKDLL